MKPIYAVCWTPKQHEVVATKKLARERMADWKERYKTAGWVVRTLGSDAYVATKVDGERHAIALHEYDSETKERIYKLPKLREGDVNDRGAGGRRLSGDAASRTGRVRAPAAQSAA